MIDMVEIKNEEMTSIPYVVYEAEQNRHERTVKRLVIALVISIVLMFVSNLVWVYEWTRYDYGYSNSTDISQDGSGVNVIGDGNGVDNGSESDD